MGHSSGFSLVRLYHGFRSLKLTVGLCVAGAGYAGAASFFGLGYAHPVFIAILIVFWLHLLACTTHRLITHPHGSWRTYTPDVVHVGILILLMGAAGSLLLREERQVILVEGDRFTVAERWSLVLQETEELPDNWVSRFVVTDTDTDTGGATAIDTASARPGVSPGAPTLQETSVNAPLRLGRYVLYQTAWERVALLEVQTRDGQTAALGAGEGFQIGPDTYLLRDADTPSGFELVWYQDDQERGAEPIVVGQNLGELIVLGVRERGRTVITLVNDPGARIALVGAILMSLGLTLLSVDLAFRGYGGGTGKDTRAGNSTSGPSNGQIPARDQPRAQQERT